MLGSLRFEDCFLRVSIFLFFAIKIDSLFDVHACISLDEIGPQINRKIQPSSNDRDSKRDKE